MRLGRRALVVLLLVGVCLLGSQVAAATDLDDDVPTGLSVVLDVAVASGRYSPPSSVVQDYRRNDGLAAYWADLARLKEWGS